MFLVIDSIYHLLKKCGKQWIKMFIILMLMLIKNGGHSFTVHLNIKLTCSMCPTSTHFNTLQLHYIDETGCLLLQYAFLFSWVVIIFVFVGLFVFLLFSPILGARSLAGGRREYGRSGRELLFKNLLFSMLLLQLFTHFVSLMNIFTC